MKCEKIAVATENFNIDDIKETSRGQLLDSWKKTYRTDAPKGISRRLMEHAAAYSTQSKIHGQLPRSIQLKLKRFQNNSHNNKVSSDLPAFNNSLNFSIDIDSFISDISPANY